MKKSAKIILIKVVIVVIANMLLCKYFGYMYLKKFNSFIKESNFMILKKGINDILKNNLININDDFYNVIYNDKKEIINVDLNINTVNSQLSNYTKIIEKKLSVINNNYLSKYYDTLYINDSMYFLLPLGMISNNPFIYNTGPKVILSYDLINIPVLKIKVDVKNYGLNNALVEMYLMIHIDQSIIRPVLTKISSYDYSILVSSKIINGRVSNYLGTNFSVESDAVSSL